MRGLKELFGHRTPSAPSGQMGPPVLRLLHMDARKPVGSSSRAEGRGWLCVAVHPDGRVVDNFYSLCDWDDTIDRRGNLIKIIDTSHITDNRQAAEVVEAEVNRLRAERRSEKVDAVQLIDPSPNMLGRNGNVDYHSGTAYYSARYAIYEVWRQPLSD